MPTPFISPGRLMIPRGGSADATVTWDLDPGVPDVTGTLSLLVDGRPVIIPVEREGRPAETPPLLVTSDPQPGQVLVSCDVATVELVDQATIRLT